MASLTTEEQNTGEGSPVENSESSQLSTFEQFKAYCKKNRLALNRRNAKLWDAAVMAGFRMGWSERKKLDLSLVVGFTAPIHSGIDGDACAVEIYDRLDETK